MNILNNTVHGVGSTGIFTSFSSNGIIQGNVSYSNGEHGFYASNSPQNVQILHNIAYGNASGGIQVNADASMGGSGTAQNLVIADNIVYNNGVSGGGALNFDGLQNSVVENNLLYNNHSSGIVLYDGDAAEGSKNNLVANNTVVQASVLARRLTTTPTATATRSSTTSCSVTCWSIPAARRQGSRTTFFWPVIPTRATTLFRHRSRQRLPHCSSIRRATTTT